MAIYHKKTNEKLILSTIEIDPGCRFGDKVVKIRASVEKPRLFHLSELMATDGPEEIAAAIETVEHPERKVKPLKEVECDAVAEAVSLFSGRIPAAANALGIAASSLYRKLRQYSVANEHPLYSKVKQISKRGKAKNHQS